MQISLLLNLESDRSLYCFVLVRGVKRSLSFAAETRLLWLMAVRGGVTCRPVNRSDKGGRAPGVRDKSGLFSDRGAT